MCPSSSQHPPSDRSELERQTLIAARALVDDMRSRYRELEKHTGASISMHRALSCIAADPGISASRLANLLGMKKPAVSQVLKGLSERGWIERLRTQADQRAVQLHLTRAGRKTLDATAGRAVGTLQHAITALSAAELEALATGITALLRAIPPLRRVNPGKPPRSP